MRTLSSRSDSPLLAGDADLAGVAAGDTGLWRRRIEQIERLGKIGSFEVDLASGALAWSEGTYKIFDLPPGIPITVAQALGYYDNAVQEEIAKRLEAAEQSGESYDLTVPFISETGRRGWIRMLGQVESFQGTRKLSGVVKDVTRERETEELLRLQAFQDVLTGLPNRRAFQAHLENALARGDAATNVALCLVDVDRFKSINDLHGHAVGDKLLQEIARRLKAAARTTDLVARLGGDEFAVIMFGLRRKEDAEQQATILLDAIRQPLVVEEELLEASISIGMSLQKAGRSNSELALRQADIALYKAKLNGRDRFSLFKASHRKEVESHSHLIAEVRTGLAQNQFDVFYQPIVDLRTRIVRGWEALVRWNHPSKGLLSPASFMPALLDPRTSILIDEFVLTTSLRQMRQWLDAGVPVTCAGVNVSEAQLRRADLIPLIVSLLDRYQLTPDRLKIEVLETAFVGQATHLVAATIAQLARLGVVSSLDDFGTGYASLTHLKQFRVERIKIDRSFISNICFNSYDKAIVKSVIGLGRNLGIRVTAEGIETVEQLKILRAFGCDCGQGYLFGRPIHADDVPAALARWNAEEALRLLGPSNHPENRVLQLVRA